MKKIVPFILLMLCLASCASSRSAEQKMQKATKVESQIADSVQNRSFTVTFNYVNSARFPITYLTSTYSLKMTGDSIAAVCLISAVPTRLITAAQTVRCRSTVMQIT